MTCNTCLCLALAPVAPHRVERATLDLEAGEPAGPAERVEWEGRGRGAEGGLEGGPELVAALAEGVQSRGVRAPVCDEHRVGLGVACAAAPRCVFALRGLHCALPQKPRVASRLLVCVLV